MTCGKVLPQETIVEEGRTWCKVLARCHGAEELVQFDFGAEYAYGSDERYEVLRRFRMHKNWFDPVGEGIGVEAKDQTAAMEQDVGRIDGGKLFSVSVAANSNAAANVA